MKPNVVTIHLARDDATGLIDANAPVLIIAPDGSKHFGRLLPGGTTMREKRWRDLYILGATPEQAAEEARTHHSNNRGGLLGRGR